MPSFKKIECKKKSTYAAEQLVEAIRQGKFSVGDRLPSERDIADSMGVSRPSVREALSALQLVGILESRPGAGTYVLRAIAGFEEAYPAFSLLEESESLHEAYEARCVLEEGIAALVCVKATDQDFEALGRALQRLEQAAANQDFEAFNCANRDFHLALAYAAHNGLLIRALEPLLEVMHQNLPRKLRKSFYRSSKRRFDNSLELHKTLYQALTRRDRDQAVSATREHFIALGKDIQ